MTERTSPDGGSVKELIIPGASPAIEVSCARAGFEPFLFSDQGTWIGCQIENGSEPGPPSGLSEPEIASGGADGGPAWTVTIPGPAFSILVSCTEDGGNVIVVDEDRFTVTCPG